MNHEDDERAARQDRDTLTPTGDIAELLGELRAALERTSELCVKVASRLTVTQLAVLTAEHRTNVHADQIEALSLRVLALEGLSPEPVAAE